MLLFVVPTLLLLLAQTGCASFLDALSSDLSSLSLWPQRRFQTEGLIDAGSLGLDNVKGMVVAVGDTIGDQTCVLLPKAARTLRVHSYKPNEQSRSFRIVT